jgi:hypothetical protein
MPGQDKIGKQIPIGIPPSRPVQAVAHVQPIGLSKATGSIPKQQRNGTGPDLSIRRHGRQQYVQSAIQIGIGRND